MENTEAKGQTREELKKSRELELEQSAAELKPVTDVKDGSETKKQPNRETVRKKKQKPKKLRIRLIPIWLRVIIVFVLIIVFFFIGAMIGYGVIGNGDPFEVFSRETWTHIFDIVKDGTPEE